MGFRFQRWFPIIPGLRVNFSESGVGGRGAWSTTGPRGIGTTPGLPGTELCYVVVEQSHKPARALGLVLLVVVLAALALVVAAQG